MWEEPIPQEKLDRMKCDGCGAPAKYQWSSCADGNRWHPACTACDVALNTAILKILRPKDWLKKIKQYCRRIGFQLND